MKAFMEVTKNVMAQAYIGRHPATGRAIRIPEILMETFNSAGKGHISTLLWPKKQEKVPLDTGSPYFILCLKINNLKPSCSRFDAENTERGVYRTQYKF